jgi:hypothetical protein
MNNKAYALTILVVLLVTLLSAATRAEHHAEHGITLRADGSLVIEEEEEEYTEAPPAIGLLAAEEVPLPPYSPFARIGYAAPSFTMQGVENGAIREFSLEEYRGKYVVLIA